MYEVAPQANGGFRPFSEFAVIDPVEDLRGLRIQDSCSEFVGFIEEIYIDLYLLQPKYALIKSRRIDLPKHFLYPIDLIRSEPYGNCCTTHSLMELADFDEFFEADAQSHDNFRLMSLSDAEEDRAWRLLEEGLPSFSA